MSDENLINEYYELIKNKMTQGEYLNAQNHCDKFISLFPQLELPYYLKGTCHYLLNEFRESKDYFLKALQIKPGHAKSYYNLGITCFFSGEKDRALVEIAKALIIFKREGNIDASNKCVDSLEFIREDEESRN